MVNELLEVHITEELQALVPEEKREALRQVLAADPRPHYQQDSTRIYGMEFSGLEIKFTVDLNDLWVKSISKI